VLQAHAELQRQTVVSRCKEGVGSVWRRIVRQVLGPPIRIPIVYYHEIGPEVSKHVVHPDVFADQVRWLVDTGFNVLSMDDLVRVYTGKRSAPPRPGPC